MKNFLHILENLKLQAKEEKKEAGKKGIVTSQSEIFWDEWNIVKGASDIRYYIDEHEFHLHLSDTEILDDAAWKKIMVAIKQDKLDQKLRVLYLARNGLSHFQLEDFTKLELLNISGNQKLESLTLKNLPAIQRVEAAHSKQLEVVTMEGNFPFLTKIDVSNGAIKEVHWRKAELPALQYFFAFHNPDLHIQWGSALDKIEMIMVDEACRIESGILPSLSKTGNDLRNFLNSTLQDIDKGKGVQQFNLLKLIFIGNTTAGKSTLRRVLLSEKKKRNEGSTHGVILFNKTIRVRKGKESKDVVIQGFDFGGQDYYHATHLPFYQKRSLTILVYGNTNFNEEHPDPALAFTTAMVTPGKGKKKEPRKEVMYPLNYWMNSLNFTKEEEKNTTHEEQKESRADAALSTWQESAKDNSTTNSEVSIVKNYSSDKIKVVSKLALVQNLRKGVHPYELNILNIKQIKHIHLSSVASYNFDEQDAETFTWLSENIFDAAFPETYTKNNTALQEALFSMGHVIYSATEIKTYVNENYKDTELEASLEYLHNCHEGYYFRPKKDSAVSFYIADMKTFFSWIHDDVLHEDLIAQGYFSKNEFQKKPHIIKHWDKLLCFLQEEKIIFPVKEDQDQTHATQAEERYVAPAYLPIPISKIDNLLLDSFNTPDCIFEFPDFFHSNIIMMIIDGFIPHLIHDPNERTYLLWKNKVILGESKTDETTSEKTDMALLLIELKFPGIDGSEVRLPQLSISRNQSGFVKDSLFKEVFDFIKKEVSAFQCTIRIKTRLGKYIPFTCLDQKNMLQGKAKTNLIFHEDTFYSKSDFRHFMEDKINEPTKIFIAYSRHDLAYVEELLLHLHPYEAEGEVEVFYDKRLSVGQKWDEETKHHLITSDLVLCMVSPEMLATEIITQIEIPTAHREGIPIIPVILRDCYWTQLPIDRDTSWLGDYNAYDKATVLPSDRYARETQWMHLAEQLSKKPTRNKGDAQVRSNELSIGKLPSNSCLIFSEEDQAYADELKQHLAALNEDDRITFTEIVVKKTTKVLSNAVMQHLHEADTLLCLLSSTLLATSIFRQDFLQLAAQQQKTIDTVILRECAWQKIGAHLYLYNKGQVLPPDRYAREAHWLALAELLVKGIPKHKNNVTHE